MRRRRSFFRGSSLSGDPRPERLPADVRPRSAPTPMPTRRPGPSESLANDWFKAIAAKDLEKTLSFYTPDAQYLSAGRPAAVTPDERRKLWVEDYGTPGFASEEATTRIEVARSGELAYQRGTYVSRGRNDKGEIGTSTGKFLVVWKKQASGGWKAIIEHPIIRTSQSAERKRSSPSLGLRSWREDATSA